MSTTVVGRTIGVGGAAGAAAGALTVVVLLVGGLVRTPPGILDAVQSVFQALVLLIFTAPVGAIAGALAGLPAGLLLAVLRPAAAVHRTAARVHCRDSLFHGRAGFTGLLAALGTTPIRIVLLTGAALVVAPLAGAWSGPYLLAMSPDGH
jgi:hypothetical protein